MNSTFFWGPASSKRESVRLLTQQSEFDLWWGIDGTSFVLVAIKRHNLDFSNSFAAKKRQPLHLLNKKMDLILEPIE